MLYFEVACNSGLKIDYCGLCGGRAKSPLWQKIFCNVLNIKIGIPQTEEGPGYGGAILAMVGGGVWTLTIDVPEVLNTAKCNAVTTKRLCEPRIAAQAFEAADGSEIDFDKDLLGDCHTDHLIPGPFASLKTGKQKITVWKKSFS